MRRSQLLLVLFSMTLVSCGDEGEGEGGEGQVVGNQAELTSTTLLTLAEPACAATSCTPINMTGRVFSASVMLGPLGDQAFGMTLLADDEKIINNPSSQPAGGTITFDLGNSKPYSGKAAIPAEDDMPSPPTVSRIEFNFDFLDTTFTLSGTSDVDGEYVVRTVFVKKTTADDVDGTMHMGDLLIKAADGEFQWCNSSTCSADRGEVASGIHQLDKVANYQHPGHGHLDYASYAVEFKETVEVSYEDISKPSNIWEIDIDLKNALGFANEPSSFSSLADILENFELRYAATQQSSGTPSGPPVEGTFEIVSE